MLRLSRPYTARCLWQGAPWSLDGKTQDNHTPNMEGGTTTLIDEVYMKAIERQPKLRVKWICIVRAAWPLSLKQSLSFHSGPLGQLQCSYSAWTFPIWLVISLYLHLHLMFYSSPPPILLISLLLVPPSLVTSLPLSMDNSDHPLNQGWTNHPQDLIHLSLVLPFPFHWTNPPLSFHILSTTTCTTTLSRSTSCLCVLPHLEF